jgi:hypothetical protein
MMGAEPTFGEILDRIRKAARNGTRLHLDYDHAVALLDGDIYAVLSAREAQEIRSRCRQDMPPVPAEPESAPAVAPPLPPIDSNWGLSGSGIAATGTTGPSVGLMDVQPAAHRRVSEVAAGLRRRKRAKP